MLDTSHMRRASIQRVKAGVADDGRQVAGQPLPQQNHIRRCGFVPPYYDASDYPVSLVVDSRHS